MATPMDEFFDRYPDFPYNPSQSVMTEFYRMCDFFGWERDDPERETARDLHRDAMVQQFNHIYGTDVNDVASWWKLCEDLNIDPIPQDLEGCRSLVRSLHVNLVDLVDMSNTGREVRLFDSLAELVDYTVDRGRYFPKKKCIRWRCTQISAS